MHMFPPQSSNVLDRLPRNLDGNCSPAPRLQPP
jgi:hypothetical protein